MFLHCWWQSNLLTDYVHIQTILAIAVLFQHPIVLDMFVLFEHVYAPHPNLYPHITVAYIIIIIHIYIYAYISPHNVMMNFIEFRIFWMIWDDYPKWLTFSSLRWSTRQRLHVSKLKSNNTSKSSSGRVPRFPWRLRAQWTLLQLATCVYV